MAKTQASGTVLKQGSTVIARLTSIDSPGAVKSEVDTTDFASTAAESLPGLIDYGDMSVSGFFDYADAGQVILRTDANDPAAVAKTFTIEFTKQVCKAVFQAWVKSYIPKAGGPNEAYTFDSVLRVTGTVVFSALP